MREIYAKHQTTLMPSDRNQVKTLQVDEQITRITTTKSRSAAVGNDEMQPEVCEDNGGKKARRRDHDQNRLFAFEGVGVVGGVGRVVAG